MVRLVFALGIGGVILTGLGCRMCANPFDTCGPVHTGCGHACGWNVPRAGSAFASGMSEAEPSEQEAVIDYRLSPNSSILSESEEPKVPPGPEKPPAVEPSPSLPGPSPDAGKDSPKGQEHEEEEPVPPQRDKNAETNARSGSHNSEATQGWVARSLRTR